MGEGEAQLCFISSPLLDLLHPYRGDRPYLTVTGADGSFRPGAELEMSPGEGDMGDKGVPGAQGGDTSSV